MSNAKPPSTDLLPHIDAPWFRVCHNLLYLPYHALFTLGSSLRVQGKANMPRTGPALVVANHESYLDPLLIGLAADRPLVYLARRTLFRNRCFAAMIRFLNAVPIDQEGLGLGGIRTILTQIKLGRAVAMFPEGSRTPNGSMLPLMPGVHLLMRRTRAPIVPVGIAGAYDAWPIWRKYPLPAPLFWPGVKRTIAVSLGKPVEYTRFAGLPREQALRELFDIIHQEKE